MFRNFEDDADKLLKNLGINESTDEYRLLAPVAQEILKGYIRGSNLKEHLLESNSWVDNHNIYKIKKVNLYDEFVMREIEKQFFKMSESEFSLPGCPPHKVASTMDGMLKKIAKFMFDNKSEYISADKLDQEYKSNAKLAKDLLDRCPLIEKTHEGYAFKKELSMQLRDYFVAKSIFDDLRKTQVRNQGSPTS